MRLLPKALLVFVITVLLHLVIYFSGSVPFFDFRFFDLLSRHKTALDSTPLNSTVVVEIDEKSLQQFGQWPWPRIILAKAVQEILRQRPAVVGLDIFFPEPDRTSPTQIKAFYRQLMGLEIQLTGFPAELADHDRVFAEVLQRGPTVLPLFVSREAGSRSDCRLSEQRFFSLPNELRIPESRHLLCNTPVLQQAAGGFGYINASVDSDGVFRRQPLMINYTGQAVPNLALAMLAQVDPELTITPPESPWQPLEISFADRKVAVNRNAEIMNLLYPKEAFQRVSAADLISGAVPAGLFTGKMVLVGASAAGLYDQYTTPAGQVLPGVFVHAALLENILQGKSIYQPEYSKKTALLISWFFSLLVVWLVFERRYLLTWGLYLGISLVSLLFAWWLLEQGIYVSLGFFLTPFSFHFFASSLFFAVLHYVERKRFLEDLGAAHSATIDSMTMVAESRDVETGSHILRTKEYVRLLAEALHYRGYWKGYLTPHIIDLLYRAAPLHDIGKVGIPDVILQKPGRLDAAELEIMRNHVGIGRKIIEHAINSYSKTNEFLTIASNISYSHHEKWDGSGYPLGLKGEDIPLEGRMMALADVYDALISRRCYKEPFTFQEAEQIILLERGKHFDPLITQVFEELRLEFRAIAEKYQEYDEINALPGPLEGKTLLPLNQHSPG
jgi:adenylate cyclase